MKDYVESNENILLHLNQGRIQHLSQGVDVDFQLIAYVEAKQQLFVKCSILSEEMSCITALSKSLF